MQTDDELQTTLSKWPFIVGDVLLVGTALTIAILSDWQLSHLQIAACVVSVALGASLYVLPYIVEFRVRIREEAEDRGAHLRLWKRQLEGAQDQLEALSDQLEGFSGRMDALSDRMGAFEGEVQDLAKAQSKTEVLVTGLGEKIEQAGSSQGEFSEQVPRLIEQVDGLTRRIDSMERTVESKLGSEAGEDLRGHLESLRSQLDALKDAANAGNAVEVANVPNAAPNAANAVEAAAPEPGTPERDEPLQAVAKRKKNRSPRKRQKPEPRLLKRAMDDKRDHSSAAVSRIIASKGVKSVEVPSAEDPEVAEQAPKREAPDSEPAEPAEPAETPDMFEDLVPQQNTRRARRKKSDTAVVASVFIGIGNKPYLRGNGAGLNWLSGVPMEFEEIGKWRWIAPDDLESPVELQIFRNDEDPDHSGKHVLEPGQQLAISPAFGS